MISELGERSRVRQSRFCYYAYDYVRQTPTTVSVAQDLEINSYGLPNVSLFHVLTLLTHRLYLGQRNKQSLTTT